MTTIVLMDSFSRPDSNTIGGVWTNLYNTNGINSAAAVPTNIRTNGLITKTLSTTDNPYYTNYEVNLNIHSDRKSVV